MHIWPVPAIDVVPFADLVERRPVALVTSAPAWEAVRQHLQLPVVWRVEPREATMAHWEILAQGLRGEVVYAVGGGLVADTAKFLAAQAGLPCVCLPTALSVDAFFTWASGIRRDGCVVYPETRSPDRVVLDMAVLREAPASIRAAGICDVLSIATAVWDWRLASEKGMNPPTMCFQPAAAAMADAILMRSLDCAEAAGRGDPEGLKELVDALVLEVTLCNLLGHARPEEGSEHYFAYAAETALQDAGHPGPWPHGDLVGPGILLMAERQGQDTKPLRAALDACHVPLDTLPSDVVEATLQRLPGYVRAHGLPFGIAHTLASPQGAGPGKD